MSKPYSEDLRERVVAAVQGGLSRRRAAGVFDVGGELGHSLGSTRSGDG